MSRKAKSVSTLLTFFLGVVLLAAAGFGEAEYGADYVTFHVAPSPGGYVLRLSGPDGFAGQWSFAAGETPALELYDDEGYPLADGLYRWELRSAAEARDRSGGDAADAPSSPGGDSSGAFTVQGGAIVDPTLPESFQTKDQVINDDLIVGFSACIGSDCANGENFGFDTLRLKENNLRIHFDDTSTSAEFPSNDWRIAINDTANGGENRFSIEDATANRPLFTIEAGAPRNSLYVNSNGDVGIGTSTPERELHILDGDSPDLRLDQDGSMGFQAQVWDVAGNEVNFFIRDVTHGSSIPFRILAGAPDRAFLIDSDGDVGIGTSNGNKVDASLHVKRSDGTAQLVVEETSATAEARVLARLVNNGPAGLELENSSSGTTWRHEADDSGSYVFDETADAEAEMVIGSDGALTVPGDLSAGTATVAGSLAAGDATVQSLQSAGDVTVSGQLSAGDATVASLASTGDATVGGALSAGDATVASLASAGDATVGGALSAGDATLGDTTAASLASTGDAAVGGALSAGNATLGDTTVASLSSTGDVTVGGALSAGAIQVSDLALESIAVTGTAATWSQSVDGDGSYVFDDAGDALAEMIIEGNGDVLIQGRVKTKGIKMSSDRNLKTDIVALNGRDVLARVTALPISAWSFKDEIGERHIGPMAQDFFASFGLGDDDRHISPLDASGVALAAIQGLQSELTEKRAELEELRQQNETLASRLAALESVVSSLAGQ